MNEDAIKDAYTLFQQDGYSKSLEEFKELMQTNENAVNDAYKLFVQDGYTKTVLDFAALMGIGEKKNPVGTGTGEEEVMVSESTQVVEEPGSSEPSLQPSNEEVDSALAAGVEQPAVVEEEESLTTTIDGDTIDIGPGNQVNTENLIKPEVLSSDDSEFEFSNNNTEIDFFEQSLEEQVNTDLISKTEENAVPIMNYHFNDYGFNFKEADITGDEMKVTAANGNTLNVELDALFYKGKYANELKQFLRKNKDESAKLHQLQKGYVQKEAKLQNKKEVEKSVQNFNSETDLVRDEYQQYLKALNFYDSQNMSDMDPNEVVYVEGPEGNEVATTPAVLLEKINIAQKSLTNSKQNLTLQGKELDDAIGGWYGMRSEQKSPLGFSYNAFLDGSARIGSGVANKMIDIATWGTNSESGGLMAPQEYRTRVLTKAREAGALGETYTDERIQEIIKDNEAYNKLKEIIKNTDGTTTKSSSRSTGLQGVGTATTSTTTTLLEDIESKILDEARKELKYGVKPGEVQYSNPFSQYANDPSLDDKMGMLEATRGGLREVIGMSETTVEATKEAKKGFWGGALIGVVESIPAMLGPAPVRIFNMITQVEDHVNEEMANDRSFDDITEGEKQMFTLPLGIVVGVLENLGFRNAIAQKGLASKILLRVLQKEGKNITGQTFRQVVKKEVNSMMTQGLLLVTASGLAEFETGLAQEIADIGFKEAYNAIKEKDMFTTPESWADGFKQVVRAGLQEAVGGFVIGTPSAISAAATVGDFTGLGEGVFEMYEDIRNEPIVRSAFIQKIKKDILEGNKTKKEGDQEIAMYDQVNGVMNKIPSDLPVNQKKELLGNLLRQQELQDDIDKYNKLLTKRQQKELLDLENDVERIVRSGNTQNQQEAQETELNTQSINELKEEGVENPTPEQIKTKRDAIQKSSPKKVDVQESTESSEEVGEGNAQGNSTTQSKNGETNIDKTTQEEVDDLTSIFNEQAGVETETETETETEQPTRRAVVENEQDGTIDIIVSDGKNIVVPGVSVSDNVHVSESSEPGIKGKLQGLTNSLLKQAKNAGISMAKLIPDLNIIIHADENNYNRSVNKDNAGTRGTFNLNTNTIHINAVKANTRTVAHEVMHAVLLKKLGIDSKKYSEITGRMLQAVIKGLPKGSNLKEELEIFAKGYALEEQNEEQVSELFGYLAAAYTKLDGPTKNIVKRWLQKVANMVGLGPDIIEYTKEEADMIAFFNSVSKKVREGTDVTEGDIDIINPKKKPKKETQKDKDIAGAEQEFIESKLKEEEDAYKQRDSEQLKLDQEGSGLSGGNISYIFQQIHAYFSGITKEDWAKYGDANWTRGKGNGTSIKFLLRKKTDEYGKTITSPLDGQARELSEIAGVEITPADFIDYMIDKTSNPGKYTQSNEKSQKAGIDKLATMYEMKKNGVIFNKSGVNRVALEDWANSLGFTVDPTRGDIGELTGFKLIKPDGKVYKPTKEKSQKVVNEKAQKTFNKFDNPLEIINKARDLNFTDPAILDYLTRVRKFTKTEVRELMQVDANKLSIIPPSMGSIVGGMKSGIKLFNKVYNNYNKLIKKNAAAKNKLSEQEIMDQAMDFLRAQPEYKKMADAVLKGISTEQMVLEMDVARALGGKQSTNLNSAIRNARVILRAKTKGQKQLRKIQRELRNFMRKTLPADIYSKSEAINLMRKIEQANNDNIQQIMNEVMEFAATKNNVRLDKSITDLLDPKNTVKRISNILKGVKIDENTRKRLASIKKRIDTGNMKTIDKVLDYISKLETEYETINLKPIKTEADYTAMADLNIIMNMVNSNNLMSNEDITKVNVLAGVETELKQIITAGRTLLKEQLRKAHVEYRRQFMQVYQDVTGREESFEDQARRELKEDGIEKPTEAEIFDKITDIIEVLKDTKKTRTREVESKKKEVKSRFKKLTNVIVTALGNVMAKNSDLFLLMDKISLLPAELFEGITQEEITQKIDAANREMKGRMLMNDALIISKFQELFGKKYKSIVTSFGRKTEAFNLPDGTEMVLSPNQMYYLYNQHKDSANHPGLEKTFSTDSKGLTEVMNEITSRLESEQYKDLKEFADWQVDVLFPSLYNHYNEAYQDTYRTQMPYNVNYAGMVYRDGQEAEGVDLLAGGKSQYHNVVAANSTKMREQNSKPIRAMDGTNVLYTYMRDMEYFSAYTRPINDINKLFTNDLIKSEIENLHGKTTMTAINTAIEKIANKGSFKEQATMDNAVDIMQDMFILSRLGINPVVTLKQLTSFVTYASDIGYGNWMKNAALSRFGKGKDVKAIWKEIAANSTYLQDRDAKSMTKAIEMYSDDAMESVFPDIKIGGQRIMTGANKESLVNILMYTTKIGDRGAIFLGGVPNYVHYKNQALEAGKTEQEAIDIAIIKFERDTKRSQQSTDLQDRDYYQTKGPIFRALNMFLTTPKQYLRKEVYAIRNMYRLASSGGKSGKGNKMDAGRIFLTYHVVMPVFFQFVANGMPGFLADWDDEDKKDLLSAAILGNINALFIYGELAVKIKDLLSGKPESFLQPKTLPILTQGTETLKKFSKYMKLKDPKKKQEALYAALAEMSQFSGLPVNNVRKIFKNMEELIDGGEDPAKVILRLFNYSEYQIQSESERKRSKKRKKKAIKKVKEKVQDNSIFKDNKKNDNSIFKTETKNDNSIFKTGKKNDNRIFK